LNKTKIIRILTTAALLSSCALPVYALTTFSDIDNSFAKDAILKLTSEGILNGKGNGKFDPTGKISRQDFAIVLAKALNLDTTNVPAKATFSDIPPNHYAFKYAEAVARAGLIKGQGNGQFGNGQNLSRQDMAVIFIRALGVDATGKAASLRFRDAASISDYAKDAVAMAVELGLLVGNSDGTFNPGGNAERQAVALVASKFLRVVEAQKKQNPIQNQPQPPNTSIPAPEQTEIPAPTQNNNSSSNGGGAGTNNYLST
jgi:hypothetical protein